VTDVADVVVVGSGIAGASLACGLAQEGLGVTVLESTEEYEDRVRGESMQLWGIKEARELGVESGPNGTRNFLEACALSCYPWSDQVTAATPPGPGATYPGDDTWTATPFEDGVVLIGDAAGPNDPVIGQGLSIAMRDARMVRDLVADGARTPGAFAGYGVERVERMRRLRFLADVISASQAEDARSKPPGCERSTL
jgi:2-polyprenyl-6-methoxyphenol hydroxylase-like FAD-dependent oxidoreductase